MSNVTGWQLQKIVDTAKTMGLPAIVSLQVSIEDGWGHAERDRERWRETKSELHRIEEVRHTNRERARA